MAETIYQRPSPHATLWHFPYLAQPYPRAFIHLFLSLPFVSVPVNLLPTLTSAGQPISEERRALPPALFVKGRHKGPSPRPPFFLLLLAAAISLMVSRHDDLLEPMATSAQLAGRRSLSPGLITPLPLPNSDGLSAAADRKLTSPPFLLDPFSYKKVFLWLTKLFPPSPAVAATVPK